MQALIRWLTSDPFRLWAAIAIGALIGLVASYARERENEHRVDFYWFRNRLMLYPFLGLATATASEAMALSSTMTAFISALLALLAFDALRVIQQRFTRQLEDGATDLRDVFKPKDDGKPDS